VNTKCNNDMYKDPSLKHTKIINIHSKISLYKTVKKCVKREREYLLYVTKNFRFVKYQQNTE